MNPYLQFGPAGEPAAWAALLAGLLAALLAWRYHARVVATLPAPGTPWRWLVGVALLAALLSVAYIEHYLRGGPRIVDSTHYYLQARALARGLLTFPVPEPLASFAGRFLLSTSDGALTVLFPPGYAAALALGFLIHAPLALGPTIAVLLVFATYWLGRELGAQPRVALGAALLGALSAALRYHTADTMSHGWAALLLAVTLAGAARATTPALIGAGLASGWLFATRPVTGLVALAGAACLALPARARALVLLPAALPGVLLLLAHQRLATGQWLESTQLAYYAVADGPPGCFRYGFGPGIGCWFEHGDYVRARLADGYGFGEAAATTLRRLAVHTLDIANAAPLALAAPLGVWTARRVRAVRVAAIVVIGQLLAYAPFYFEGSYPGGGARFYADILPLQHIFVAWGLSAVGALRFAWPISLIGFALHTHQQHASLRDREGGRPMFERETLERAGVLRGLVFVSTDHGFALGHEPGRLDANAGVVVARQRNDALDRMLWESLGRPPSFVYEYDASADSAEPKLRPLLDMPSTDRIEGESLWPPLAVDGGWVHPAFSGTSCVSRGRAVRIRPNSPSVSLRLALPANRPAHLVVGWSTIGPSRAGPSTTDPSTGEPPPLSVSVAEKTFTAEWRTAGPGCWHSAPLGPLPVAPALELTIRGSGLIDYFDITGTPVERR